MAAKRLFAQQGYEQTSTAAIAREAGTSESQLVRYFGGKAGLLEAIFDESWSALVADMAHLRQAKAGEALTEVVTRLITAFGSDPDLAFLFLFEGRRVRGQTRGPTLSKGFRAFVAVTRELIRRGRTDGTFGDYNEEAVASALLGAAEGMIRDRLMLARAGATTTVNDDAVRRVFQAILHGLSDCTAR